MTSYVYTGAEERIYSAYLSVRPDGTVTTLHGRPGADPVVIRKASGADYDPDADEHGREVPRPPLPDTPADGLWALALDKPAGDGEQKPPGDQPGGKSRKAAA